MRKIYKTLVLTVALLAATAVPSFSQEAELLAVLRSDATLEEKSAACRQLARVATKEAVPILASLLDDEKLSHMARYALETIRDPSVDDALREALGRTAKSKAKGTDPCFRPRIFRKLRAIKPKNEPVPGRCSSPGAIWPRLAFSAETDILGI